MVDQQPTPTSLLTHALVMGNLQGQPSSSSAPDTSSSNSSWWIAPVALIGIIALWLSIYYAKKSCTGAKINSEVAITEITTNADLIPKTEAFQDPSPPLNSSFFNLVDSAASNSLEKSTINLSPQHYGAT